MLKMMRRSVLVTAALLALPGATSRVAAQAKITGIVRSVAHRAGGANWTPSKVGTTLGAGASVRTGKRSKCEVKVGSNLIKMSERSSITLRGNQISLDGGKVYGNFKKDMVIKGGNTTATIKGTIVVMSIDWVTGEFIIDVIDGGPAIIDIPGLPNPIQVNQGQKARVPLGMLAPGAAADDDDDAGGGQAQGGVIVEDSGNTTAFVEADTGTYTSGFEVTTGEATVVTPGASDQVNIALDQISIDDVADSGGDEHQNPAKVVQAIRNVVITPGDETNPPQFPPVDTGSLDLQLRQPGLTRQMTAKQGFLAPRLDGNTFLYKRDSSRAVYGARLTETGLYNNVFYQFGVSPQTLFQGEVDVELSDAFTVFRNPDTFGDIVVGRQRFLKGPIQNVTTGTLITQDIMDAITWTPPIKTDPRLSVDLSLLHDAFPFAVPGNQGGWHVRGEFQGSKAAVGVNLMRVNGIGFSPTGRTQIGVTVDAATPLVPNKLDLYGEFGSNVFGQNIETWGAYFPRLYEKWNIDAYLETTQRVGAAPGITALRMYWNVAPNLTVLMTADKVQGIGGINGGIGLVAKLFK